MKPLNVLSLFAGIGGLELGLERAGMHVVGQVELDVYCRRVLAKHWPDVPQHDDVRTATDWWQSTERPKVDVVCGGFPCQPFSPAGLRLGTADERWGWPWFADVVRALGPRYVVVENVAALLDDRPAFGRVLSDLADNGFDAEWSVLSAQAVGAPHRRERLFLVAHAAVGHVPNQGSAKTAPSGWGEPRGSRRVHHLNRWLPEPAVDRVADGVPVGLVRGPLHALGNAVVPQVAEHVGRLIVAHHETAVAAA